MENIVLHRIEKATKELKTGFAVEFWYIKGEVGVPRVQKFIDKISTMFHCQMSVKMVESDADQPHGFVLPPHEKHVWFNVTPMRYKNLHISYRFEYVYDGIEDMGNAVSDFIKTVKFYEKPKQDNRRQKRND